jgi:hypothetical protein
MSTSASCNLVVEWLCARTKPCQLLVIDILQRFRCAPIR